MRIEKKTAGIVFLLFFLAVTGCGKAYEPQKEAFILPEEAFVLLEEVFILPEKAALIYCNIAVKQDFREAEKIGLTKEMQAAVTEAYRKTFRQSAIEIMRSWGVKEIESAEEDVKCMDRFTEGMEQINRKIDIKTAFVSQNESGAIVNISVRTIDGERFYHGIVEPVLRSAGFSRLTDDLERANFIALAFSRMGGRIELVEKSVAFEAQFVFDNETGYWQPADDHFGEKLIEAVSW